MQRTTNARVQAAALLRAFSIGDEMVLAAALLFSRCIDLDDNIMALTEVLADSSQDKLHNTLGWWVGPGGVVEVGGGSRRRL